MCADEGQKAKAGPFFGCGLGREREQCEFILNAINTMRYVILKSVFGILCGCFGGFGEIGCWRRGYLCLWPPDRSSGNLGGMEAGESVEFDWLEGTFWNLRIVLGGCEILSIWWEKGVD